MSIPKDEHSIALVCADLRAGGTQRVVCNASRLLSGMGYVVTVVTLADTAQDFYSLPDGVSRIALGVTGDSKSLVSAIAANLQRLRVLRASLRALNAKTVVSFLTATNVLTLAATVGLRTKIVVSERNDPWRQPLSAPWRLLRRLTYPLAFRVTANSRDAVEALSKLFGRTWYLPNPLPTRSESHQAREDTVLVVGRLSHQKAYDVLLRAFARALGPEANRKAWRLIIVGTGEQGAALRELARELRLGHRVEWLSDVRTEPLYARAGIFVLASRYEGMSNALLEAFAAGCPVIATNRAARSIPFVVHGENALIVPSDSTDALADALVSFMGDERLRAEKAREGKAAFSVFARETNVEAEWASVLGLRRAT